VVRTAKGDWLAVVQPPAGAKVCPPLVREALGDGKLTPLALIVRNARLSKAAEGQPQILRLVQAGRDPLFVDETLRINLLKPGEMDLAPLARTLRRAIIEADRLAKQAATEKAAADRQRKKPKRAKR